MRSKRGFVLLTNNLELHKSVKSADILAVKQKTKFRSAAAVSNDRAASQLPNPAERILSSKWEKYYDGYYAEPTSIIQTQDRIVVPRLIMMAYKIGLIAQPRSLDAGLSKG